MPSSESSSVVSTKKVVSSVGEYIWNSPCLKPLVFNPFLISILILGVIWVTDFWYGKTFQNECNASVYIQHIFTSFVLVACGVSMNNILIKHYYRMEKCKKKATDTTVDGAGLDPLSIEDASDLVQMY